MSTENRIGLDSDKVKELADKLNNLLANYSVFYQNTRGFHWNIKGDSFFVLHEKFEELYDDLKIKIDEVAERVLTLGYTPNHQYSKYMDMSDISESGKVTDGKEAVNHILEAFKVTIKIQREILKLSDDAGDEGTNALMSDYISEQEKLVWMYASYVNK
ncbi:MAG: DNA starvation/stationary phase protection protein [Bacteroidetes bacterium]|jgi:starvation-inducible DNA-binding protein|nr:DNA starvation/stationary phase protection protein [Bacteroidota bacterium]